MEKFQLFKFLIDKQDENAFTSNYLQKSLFFKWHKSDKNGFFWLLFICVSKLRKNAIKLRFPDMIWKIAYVSQRVTKKR